MIQILMFVYVLLLFYPVFYAYRLGMKNKMLFLFASYGSEVIVSALLMGVGVPVYILTIYMLPQLVSFDSRYGWLGYPVDWGMEYFWLLTPLFLFFIPRLIYSKYNNFFDGAHTHEGV